MRPSPAFTADDDTPTPVEPDHVSEDVELVEAVAEAGAEDGAGAQVSVAELLGRLPPAQGRRRDRSTRFRTSPEELAAIELYELFGRKRQTVIAAAKRELSRRG